MMDPSKLLISTLFLALCLIHTIHALQEDSADEEEASPIFYEKPSLARLSATAVSKQTNKGCVYKKQKYLSGEEVKTEQPCLRCTCKRGVLLCALRICPPVTVGNLSAPSSRCQVFRQPTTCCPTVQCLPSPQDERAQVISEMPSKVKNPTTTITPLLQLDAAVFTNSLDRDETNRSSHMVSVTHLPARNTTILQTVPSSNFPDKHVGNSPFLVSPHSLHNAQLSKESYVTDLLNGIGKHCFINGTFYAEGSAIISSSYCEYCYCIRGKRMCIRPRCHLSILGCLPRYSSEYACCPTSYACGDEALATPNNSTTSNGNTNGKWSLFYALDDKLSGVDHEGGEFDTWAIGNSTANEFINSVETEPTTASSVETSSESLATTTLQTIQEKPKPLPGVSRMTDCIFDGISYKTGDAMPADQNCTQCYCAVNGTRICKAIHCSLYLRAEHNCIPIIPEGHCCPIEYKCDPEPFPTKQEIDEAAHSNKNVDTKEDSPLLAVSSEQTQTHSPLEIPKDSTDRIETSNSTGEPTMTTSELISEEFTTLKSSNNNETEPSATESALNVFSLFANQDENPKESSVNGSSKLSTPEARNTTNEFDSINSPIIPESRSDEPNELKSKNTKYTIQSRSDNEGSTSRNIPNQGSIKLENVASFLSNIFTAFGLSGKAGQDRTKHVLDYKQTHSLEPMGERQGPLVGVPSFNQVEIITEQPSMMAHQLNPERILSLASQPHPFVQIMPNNLHGNDHADISKYLTAKPNRNSIPIGNANYLSKNIFPDKLPNQKMHTFSNGWRAIPVLKPSLKPKPSLHTSNESHSVMAESASPKLEYSTTTVPSTTVRMETSPTERQIIEKQNIPQGNMANNPYTADVDISKAKCVFDGKEYEHNAIIPKPNNLCIYCGCFYGKEICQEQKCPAPPSADCVADRVANQCCPVYTCLNANSTAEAASLGKNEDSNLEILPDKSPIRRGPQFEREPVAKVVEPVVSSTESILSESRLENDLPKFKQQNIIPVLMQNKPPILNPFSHQTQPRISFPFDPLPRPLDLIYGSPLENRIHFPQANKHLNLPPNLPPGIILSPNLPNQVLNMNKPFLNRPIHPNALKLPHNKLEDIQGGINSMNSPIRPLPQSPTMVEKPTAPEEPQSNPVGSRLSEPAVVSTESPMPLTTTSRSVGPWDILQVSGCNIYGIMFKTNQEISQLSSDCKKCICSSHGVQCKQIC